MQQIALQRMFVGVVSEKKNARIFCSFCIIENNTDDICLQLVFSPSYYFLLKLTSVVFTESFCLSVYLFLAFDVFFPICWLLFLFDLQEPP